MGYQALLFCPDEKTARTVTQVLGDLEFSVDSANDFSQTVPEFLTDSGILLGSYELFSGTTDKGSRVFYWSEANGFHDLGALAGMTSAGWESLEEVYDSLVPGSTGLLPDGYPEYVVGTGYVNGQAPLAGSDSEPFGHSVFLISAVPEPTSPALVGLTIPLVLRRRRSS